ncbi:MAG: ATP-dependent Clp protease proteolytic subunit [Ramlibacter sp.]|nr:ATP-dependent Clp protease proteolytic subunit [Ramlibacter sp.]
MGKNNGNRPESSLPSLTPDVRLIGNIDEQMLQNYLNQCGQLQGGGPVVLELSTSGGEADTARRLAQEVRMLREAREVFFLGKTYVYSAGITVMAAVPPSHRFLTRDTVLLIHERRMERTVQLSGALRSAMSVAQDLMAELEIGQQLERRGFEQLVEGSALTADALMKRVMEKDWYMQADEALSLRLVAGLVG